MTQITKLVMKGFKSFANKTEVVFGDGYNCVLGPNGSGKSNVLDAICFVLGKSSSKGLRAEKTANLIYNGGKKKNPAKDASVEIFFDNISKVFPVEGSEVKISRQVSQKGQSKYLINDKVSTRQQIIDLLSIARINPEGYNIILQGDIVRLTEMSTKERLKLVEEISGISIYEEKKQKALNELIKVEDRLKEADIILAEKKIYLRELKKERDQAMKFKNLNEKIKGNKVTYLDIQINTKDKELEKINSKKDKSNDRVDNFQDQISELMNDVQVKKEEMDLISKEIEQKGEKEQVVLHKEVGHLRVSIETNKVRIDTLKSEIEKIDGRKEQLKRNINEVNNKVLDMQKEKVDLESRKDSLQKEQDLLDKKVKQFKEKNKMDSVSDIDKELDLIDKESEKKQENIQNLRSEQQEILREKDRLEYQINTVDEKIEKVLLVEKEHKQELTELKNNKKRFSIVTVELNKRLNEDSSLAAQIDNALTRVYQLREEMAKINAKTVIAREVGKESIKQLLKNKDQFKGIHGLVSDLGRVDNKYSIALEVVAGSRINSLIVDTDKTATNCIGYLRRNKLGLATFLPLNKIRSMKENPEIKNLKKANGVEGLALDLISFDSKYKKAFSYVFGNTLVVDTINAARRIGIGSVRMVSLEGDLVETSGVMHGGFRKKQGRFLEKNLTNDLEKVESKLVESERVISNLEETRKENEQRIDELRSQKARLEAEIIKAEKMMYLDSSDLEVNKKLKFELKQSFMDVDDKSVEVQKILLGLNKALTTLKIKKQELKEKIGQLRNPTLIAEINAFQQKKQDLGEEIIRVDLEIKNLDSHMELLNLEDDKTKKILKQHDNEKEEFRTELEKLQGFVEKNREDLKNKEVKESKFMSQFKGLFNKRNDISTAIQKDENNIMNKQEEIRKIETSMNSVLLESARLSVELSALRQELKEYEGVPFVKDKSEEQLKREIWQFEKMASDLGAINMKALEIYEKIDKEYFSLLYKKESLDGEKTDILIMMNEIDTKKKSLFMETFESLDEHFKSIFSQLSVKGDASLKLENSKDPFEGGLEIKVKITSKKFLDMRSLSGGEKTMTALAFLFAVQEFEPASFYLLDEVDAALDKHNSEKFANLIRDYSNKAQYLIISHNDSVISEADNLYGVSMNELGISNTVSLKI